MESARIECVTGREGWREWLKNEPCLPSRQDRAPLFLLIEQIPRKNRISYYRTSITPGGGRCESFRNAPIIMEFYHA